MTQITLSVYAEIKNSENLGINNNIENINRENNRNKLDELTKWDYLVIAAFSSAIIGIGQIPICKYNKDKSVNKTIFNKTTYLWLLITIGMLLVFSALLLFCRTFFTNTELKFKTFLNILLIIFLLPIILSLAYHLTHELICHKILGQ